MPELPMARDGAGPIFHTPPRGAMSAVMVALSLFLEPQRHRPHQPERALAIGSVNRSVAPYSAAVGWSWTMAM